MQLLVRASGTNVNALSEWASSNGKGEKPRPWLSIFNFVCGSPPCVPDWKAKGGSSDDGQRRYVRVANTPTIYRTRGEGMGKTWRTKRKRGGESRKVNSFPLPLPTSVDDARQSLVGCREVLTPPTEPSWTLSFSTNAPPLSLPQRSLSSADPLSWGRKEKCSRRIAWGGFECSKGWLERWDGRVGGNNGDAFRMRKAERERVEGNLRTKRGVSKTGRGVRRIYLFFVPVFLSVLLPFLFSSRLESSFVFGVLREVVNEEGGGKFSLRSRGRPAHVRVLSSAWSTVSDFLFLIGCHY